MAAISQPTLFDEILDFLAMSPSAQAIVEYRPSQQLQARASSLLEKQRDEGLSAAEIAELDEFGRMNHFMIMLKARARQLSPPTTFFPL
jgi:hypothetical protein